MTNNILCISRRQPQTSTNPHIIPLLPSARWILIPAGAKAPNYAGWQRGGYDAAAALAHAGRGGNLGLLCGPQSGDLIALDADAGATELRQYWPQLAHTLRIWRSDAPDRAKFILRCAGAQTMRDHTAGLEILAGTALAGTNAVVWGRHPGGAQYQFDGDAVIDVSVHDLASIWRWRTGSTQAHEVAAGTPRRPTAKRRIDAGALAFDTRTPIIDLLLHAGCRQSARNPRRWVPPQSAHGTDSLLVNTDTNTIWAFSAHNPLGREGLIYPHQLAHALGISVPKPVAPQAAQQATQHTAAPTALPTGNPTADSGHATAPDTLPQLLAGWRHAAIHGDLAPQWRAAQRRLATEYGRRADAALRQLGESATDDAAKGPAARAAYWRQQADAAAARADGTRWPEPALRRLMLAMLDLFEELGGRKRWLSDLRIASAANMAAKTATRHLDSLDGWFVVIDRRGERMAPAYTLHAGWRNVVGFTADLQNQSAVKPTTLALTDPLRTHYGHDAFSIGWTPMPDDGDTWALVCETADRIRTGTTTVPDDTTLPDYPPAGDAAGSMQPPPDDAELDRLDAWRRRCAAGYMYISRLRMGADLASLGGRALLLLQRLADAGGQLEGNAAAEALGCTRATLSRLLSRCVDAGVVDQPAWGQIRLAPDWVETLEASVKAMPSYGMYAARRAAWLDSRIARLDDAMLRAVQTADAEPAQAEAAAGALGRLQTQLDDAEGERASWDVWAEENLPDTQRRRVLTRHGTWDSRQQAQADARRQDRQRRRDRSDAAAEAQRQAESDAAAGVTPAMRQRADKLYQAFGIGR
jgi:hypothetical protein